MSRSIGALVLISSLAVPAFWAGDSGTGGAAAVPHREIDDATLERLIKLHHIETEEVRLVLLPTSVTDRRGRAIRGLKANDFRLYQDQVSQEIKYFSSEAIEDISIAFMLDVSGSMRQLDKMTHAKEAIRFLVGNLRQSDSYSLICFADDQVAWVTDFTNDKERFLARLDVQEGYGQTALFDAVAAAPALVDDKIKGRKAIVLITDGIDNFSRLDSMQAVELARRVNVPIYAIGFLSVPERMLPQETEASGLGNLRSFSAETGGRLFAVHDPDELKEAMTYLDNELRFQYVIGYYPKGGDESDFHRIQLDVGKSRMQVRTRSGYYD